MNRKKALLIRLDRLGDLVLTLPADQQKALADYECLWFISQGLSFVPSHAVPPRAFREWKKEFSWKQFFQFLRAVKEFGPDVSISFHSPAWVMLALFLAKVPLRIGVLSRWSSFLFLNRGIRQKRSQCLYHEMEYNHLLVHAGLQDTRSIEFPHLELKPSVPTKALSQKYFIVHPGMAGSAKNWPLENYQKLIEKLSPKTMIAITGTATDQPVLGPLKEALSPSLPIVWMDGLLKGPELLSFIQNSSGLLAPSTGVVHLAASLGIPTFGIYSAVHVESVKRWGPQGRQVKTWSAPHTGPDGMALVSVEEVYQDICQKIF